MVVDLYPMSFSLTIEDPQGTENISNAYGVLTEVHMNFELQAFIGVFKIWRSREAYQSGRQHVTIIQVPVKPEEGGKDFFAQRGIDGAGCQLGPHILNWCVARHPQMAGATVKVPTTPVNRE